MAENSPIEWTDHTWSPWEKGCTKVSPGCDHCYAERMNRWLHKAENWGPGAPRHTYSDDHWDKPRKWNDAAAKSGTQPKVFPSVCDPFDSEAPVGARAKFARVITGTPHLTWLLLSKRIGNAAAMLARMFPEGTPANLWLGATIVNQDEADRDIPKLLATRARVRFLSMEPLLGSVNLWLPTRTWKNSAGSATCDHCCNGDRCDDPTHCERGRPEWRIHCAHCRGTGSARPIDWVITGGESGPGARPAHPNWFRRLRDQCAANGTPFLFKQWGEWSPVGPEQAHDCAVDATGRVAEPLHRENFPAGATAADGWSRMYRVGKKAAGRLLDGVEHNAFPEVA